jgi:hypothetical protein
MAVLTELITVKNYLVSMLNPMKIKEIVVCIGARVRDFSLLYVKTPMRRIKLPYIL